MSKPLKPFRLLSSLRKYDGQKPLEEWSSTELMQNFKAIELAFENLEKNLFLGDSILNQTFSSTTRVKIPKTEIEFDLSSDNFASFGFRGAIFKDVSTPVVRLICNGDALFYIMRKNLISGEIVELSPLRLTGAVLRPTHIFYMELLPKGKYSYFMEGRVIATPNVLFEQIQFFVKVG